MEPDQGAFHTCIWTSFVTLVEIGSIFNCVYETFNPRPKCKICVKNIYSMDYCEKCTN